MARENSDVAFQNGKSRKRLVLLLSAVGVIGVIVGIVHNGSSPRIVLEALVFLLAYRNWFSGLFLTANSVIVRNVLSTRRLTIDQVSGARLVTGKFHFTEWGYIKLEKKDGDLVKVTALRRSRIDGRDLAQSINAELNKRRSTS